MAQALGSMVANIKSSAHVVAALINYPVRFTIRDYKPNTIMAYLLYL